MKKRKIAGSLSLILLMLFLAVSFVALKQAHAFTSDYEFTDENDLQFEVKQRAASSSDPVKYATVAWYLFREKLGEGGNENRDYTDATSGDWGPDYAFQVETTVVKRTPETGADSSGYFYQILQMDGDEVIKGLQSLYDREELLSGSLDMYASRVLKKTNASGTQTGGQYWNFNEFSASNKWSSGTLISVSQGYNTPISVGLSTAGFTVRFVELDEEGEEIGELAEGFSFEGAWASDRSSPGGKCLVGDEVLYGEKLTFGALAYPSSGYTYKGYCWNNEISSLKKSASVSAITVNRTLAPEEELVLTFCFVKKPAPTPLPFVSATPTTKPEAGEDIEPTATPTPAPTSTPIPTPQPDKDEIIENSYYRYYTTDAGYYIGGIASDSDNYLVSYTSLTGSGTIPDSEYTSRSNSYKVGTDAAGNTWYFIADGTKATYVHPKVYNGYTVDSAEVKYITELTFPSIITSGSTTYTVTDIGGGTDTYKTTESDSDGSYNSAGNGYIKEWSYGTLNGTYYYTYDWYTSSSDTNKYRNLEISYRYGVIGNGHVASYGYNYTGYNATGAIVGDYFGNSYYVYNTTLKKVTIPSTVTSINSYAFQNCQALETIEGGEGLLTINSMAFSAVSYPKSTLSMEWTDGSSICNIYYYYNGDYSTVSRTDIMTEWEVSSALDEKMEFPYLPVLQTIGYMAFFGHHNIDNVDLSATVSKISEGAFLDCKLENIRIPNVSCSITNDVDTLGTKGSSLTGIHTVPDSTALSYGLKYNNAYKLYCGHPVTYEPNGGTGSSTKVTGELHVSYLETDHYLEYSAYYQSGVNEYAYYSSSTSRYVSYLDENGGLWKLDTINKTVAQISPGTTFTKLFGIGVESPAAEDGRTTAAQYAWDTEGNLWFSGQYMRNRTYSYVSEEDGETNYEWYQWYSDDYDWQKLPLPDNAVDVKFSRQGVFFLDTDGNIWCIYPGNTSSPTEITGSNSPAFKAFAIMDYQGDAEKEHDCDLYGVDTSGVIWTAYQDGLQGFSLSNVNGTPLYASDFIKVANSKFNNVTAGNVADVFYVEISALDYMVVLTNDGNLEFSCNGSYKKSLSGYGFVEAEPVDSLDATLLAKDASGNTYLVSAVKSGSATLAYANVVAGPGVEVKNVWKRSKSYSSYTNTGTSSTSYRNTDVLWYIWTDDGYLTAVKNASPYCWKMADVTFKKVYINEYNLFAIAEDQTLWSSGENQYGQMGNSNAEQDLGFKYPVYNSIAYLTKTGTRTYADVDISKQYYTLALGTDSLVYFAGDTSRYTGMTTNGKINEFVLCETQPVWAQVNKFVLGYDYDTEIAYGLFAREGYEFTGWNTKADGSGTGYQPGDLVDLTSALTLYAQWGAKSKYITFRANGGSGYMPAMTFPYAQTTATLTKNLFSRSGYEFVGWNTRADGTGTSYADQQTITGITGNLVLYAQWNKIPISYQIIYMKYPYGTEGNTVWKTKTLTYEQTETTEGAPYTSSGYTVAYSTNKTADMSTTPDTLTLSSVNTQTSAPAFERWLLYKEVNGTRSYRGRSYAEGQTISRLTQTNGDVFYLYPSWNEANASVLLPQAACEGYGFLGWSETADGTGPVYTVGESDEDGIYTSVKDTTLYAVWVPKEFCVTLNGRGATSEEHTKEVYVIFDTIGPDILVPAKNGYIFQGYYTGMRGTGTKYYDENGSCIKPWTEADKDVLYAYWVRENTNPPESGDHVEPTPLPEIDVVGSMERMDAKGLIYADDYNSETGALTDLQPYLTYDTPSSEGAIPGTEEVAIRIRMGAWMWRYRFHRYTGTDYVRIYVTVPYRIQYESEEEELLIRDRKTATYSYMVPKTWSYWAVLESGIFYPEQVTVANDGLKEDKVTIVVDRSGDYTMAYPVCEVINYGEKENHVIWPEYDADDVPVLRMELTEEQYIFSEDDADVDDYLYRLCEDAAWKDTGQAEARSDNYVLNGVVLLSDAWREDGNGSALQEEAENIEMTSYSQTYLSGIELDERALNSTYSTTAIIDYIGDSSNIGTPEAIQIELKDINDLKIHTPVACQGMVEEGMEKAGGRYTLVLKDALNHFRLRIDNSGLHRMSLGYGNKDFLHARSGKSNVVLNQVQFPFDVYVDEGEAYDTSDDYYLEAGSWLTIGDSSQQFYVPVTMKNGKYSVKFRTVAVNCPMDEDGEFSAIGKEQSKVNINSENYIATDSLEIEVLSYLSGFDITGTNEKTASEKLQEGNKALTLKKGYGFSFELLSQGEFYGENAELSVVPRFFWEASDKSERLEVDLYRAGNAVNTFEKIYYAWEEEILKRHENHEVIKQRFPGTGMIPADILCVISDTKQGYCEGCDSVCYVYGGESRCNVCLQELSDMEDFSPEEYMLKQTITGKEPFFKQNGYLIINLEIRVKSNQNVWYKFTEWKNTELAKDALSSGWNYIPGDVIRYDLSRSIAEDYEIGAIE